MSIILGYDPETLREKVDLLEVGHRLKELGAMRSLDALCERSWLLRVGGNLDEALAVANEAYRLARFTGDRQSLQRPRMLRAQTMEELGRLDDAAGELSVCIEDARTHEWPLIEAYGLHYRGRVHLDQGQVEPAVADFKAALRLREDHGAPMDQLEATEFAVSVAERRLKGDG